jgi:hypothetical protein
MSNLLLDQESLRNLISKNLPDATVVFSAQGLNFTSPAKALKIDLHKLALAATVTQGPLKIGIDSVDVTAAGLNVNFNIL